jgi:hypothetical protein
VFIVVVIVNTLNTPRGQSAELLSVEADGTYSMVHIVTTALGVSERPKMASQAAFCSAVEGFGV